MQHAKRSSRVPHLVRPWLLLWLAITLIAPSGGCVRRRMTIRTDQPGATVYVDQREIGVTPVSTSFTYYGTRNFVVSKDGYETVAGSRTFHPPWYQYPGVDFIVENLWPFEVRDERVVDFQLVPKQTVPTQQLIRRGDDLRFGAAHGHAAPLPTQLSDPAPIPPVQSLFPPPSPWDVEPELLPQAPIGPPSSRNGN
jgi:hypothetical protein